MVEWNIRNRRLEGTIIEDEARRSKLVLLHPKYQGRKPAPRQRTAAEILREVIRQRDLGPLLVRPIFEGDPDYPTKPKAVWPLDSHEVRELMRLLIVAEGPIFGVHTIRSDIPNWGGTLTARPWRIFENHSLYVSWSYCSDDGKTYFPVPSVYSALFLASPGIKFRKGKAVVTKWRWAIQGLGAPFLIEPDGKDERVTWKDKLGNALTATLTKYIKHALD